MTTTTSGVSYNSNLKTSHGNNLLLALRFAVIWRKLISSVKQILLLVLGSLQLEAEVADGITPEIDWITDFSLDTKRRNSNPQFLFY